MSSPANLGSVKDSGHSRIRPSSAANGEKSEPWNDLWAAKLFYAHLLIFLAIFGYTCHSLASVYDTTLVWTCLESTVVSVAVSICCAVLWLWLSKAMPERMLHVSHIALIAQTVIWFVVELHFDGFSSLALNHIIRAVLFAFMYWINKPLIPMAAVLLTNTMDIVQEHPRMLWVSAGATAVQTVYSLVATVCYTGMIASFTYSSSATFFGVMQLVLGFSVFWTVQVIQNVALATFAGVFGMLFLTAPKAGQTNMKMHYATGDSLKRAMTSSFGSVCFGSLVMAVVNVMAKLLRVIANQNDLLRTIVGVLLKMFEAWARLFNYYAMIFVGAHKKDYRDAGMSVIKLLDNHGGTVITNDNIMSIYCMFSALSIGYFVAILMRITHHVLSVSAYGASVSSTGTFISSYTVSYLILQVIHAGSATTLVCYIENPLAVKRARPAFANTMDHKYRGYMA